MNCWEKSPETASLQILNFILLLCDVTQSMNRADFQTPDPAAVLAELQDEWTISGKADALLLSPKNKSKTSKTIKKNFGEFFKRLGAIISADTTKVKWVIGWLITMSSSGYRPLRHASSLACYRILRGAAGRTAALGKELDQASKLSKSKTLVGGAKHVDSVGTEMATVEKTMQLVFDAVFVQRFRDIDYFIREESVDALGEWIAAYPEVFLDNAYLRYIGWALSDRRGSVRCKALEVFGELYREGSLREGMSSFKVRFIGRVMEMAHKDIELVVRNSALRLLLVIGKYEDEAEEFNSQVLEFLSDKIRYCQPLTKEALLLLKQIILESEGEELLVERSNEMKFSESKEFVAATCLIKFLMAIEIPQERRALCLEYFVQAAKGEFGILRDITIWIKLTDLIISDHDCPRELNCNEAMETIFYLLQACARYGMIFITSPADTTRQMIDGISRTHSHDLATVLGPYLMSWIKRIRQVKGSFDIIGLIETIELADAMTLAEHESVDLSIVVSHLAQLCSGRCVNVSLINLLSYLEQCHVPGIHEFIVSTITTDISALDQTSTTNISRIQWKSLASSSWPTRLAELAAKGRSMKNISIASLCDLITKVIQFLDDQLGHNNAVNSEIYLLERDCLPSLLKLLIHIDDEAAAAASAMVMAQPELYSTQRPYSSSTALGLLHNGKVQVRGKTEEVLIECITNIIDMDDGLHAGSLFDMARLYLEDLSSKNVVVAAFGKFGSLTSSVGLKCFAALWDNLVIKEKANSLVLAKDILLRFVEEKDVIFLPILAKLLAEGIKKMPEVLVSEHVVALHMTICTAGSDATTLTQLLLPFTPMLSPNLAIEQLAATRKSHPDAREYINALVKASTRRSSTPRRTKIISASTGASRLREVQDGENTSELNEANETPIKEIAGLRMSSFADEGDGEMGGGLAAMFDDRGTSNVALTSAGDVPSSPLITRKRTVRL